MAQDKSHDHLADQNSIQGHDDLLSWIVKLFLTSKLSLVLILVSIIVGFGALMVTPREEDPQIVVPLADIFVSYPGHSADEVEQHVSTKLERLLYQIDGVEYVYSMSKDNSAVITVRFYVGQDREDSLVKVFKKINENMDIVPSGVTQWIVKPVEIDDVPIVTLALQGASGDTHMLRRIGEELVERLAAVPSVSRVQILGGEPRRVQIRLDRQKLEAYSLDPATIVQAMAASNKTYTAGDMTRENTILTVESGIGLEDITNISELVIGVSDGQPIFLKDVAAIEDSADEPTTYVRHGWGPSSNRHLHIGSAGTRLDSEEDIAEQAMHSNEPNSTILSSQPSVTLAVSKQKGSNAVQVATRILEEAKRLQKEVVPDDVEMVVTRNYGLVANEKVNELIEALSVAILIVVVLLTLSMGWREAIVVALAVPVVFGLTLAVNLAFGYTINRVTLFALILSLGLLVDDPIVDVENIARHFHQKGRASMQIVMDAVAEIRPPLISATLAVIVSFIPMFFITGMMGPYMSPMALNVPIAMLMSMVVAFTITPWLAYHVLKGAKWAQGDGGQASRSDVSSQTHSSPEDLYDPEELKKSPLYRFFKPLMMPLMKSRSRAILFLLVMAVLTAGAASMAMFRWVPLKMLPFDNKNELLLLVDMPEGSSLEKTDAMVREIEDYVATIPEVTDYSSFVGTSGPIDFNGMVRHYYLRQAPFVGELRMNLVGKKARSLQSHGIALRERKPLERIAERYGALLRIVELPPGPPVLSSIVAEVYGSASMTYEQLLDAGTSVARRLERELGVKEVNEIREEPASKWTFVVDKEKAAVIGISTEDVANVLAIAVEGDRSQSLRMKRERQPLSLTIRLPVSDRSDLYSLSQIRVRSQSGSMVPIAEIGQWRESSVGQTIYHKNLRRVVYVDAESVGRPPAECVLDVQADLRESLDDLEQLPTEPKPLWQRTYFSNGSNLPWSVPKGVEVHFAGEGEWKITIDVFRDLGLAFGAAMIMIYVILVAQTGSFLVPLVVMLAIPLTALGVMPGFWMLNQISGQTIDGFADPVYFTATAMIGMIALSGIVTRDSIILVDFIGQTVAKGRPIIDAILESRVVRLRPILLTAGAAMLSSLPITLDPIFSGLGWSLIFGLLASTIFTLFVIPITYWLIQTWNDPVA